MQLLLFLAFPAVELYLLVKAGALVGALNVVLWVFVSAAIGIWAVRAQGQGAMLKVQSELSEGRVPQNPFLEGLLIFLGGVLLILPGLISDAIGLLLLIPPMRHAAALGLTRYFASQQAKGAGAGTSRVIFFRSSGFPGFGTGAGGPFQPGPAPGSPFDRPRDPGAQGEIPRAEYDDSPRQATIIESSAIDLTGNDAAGAERGKDPAGGSGNGPSGGKG